LFYSLSIKSNFLSKSFHAATCPHIAKDFWGGDETGNPLTETLKLIGLEDITGAVR
jgi:hypothetical protein